MKKLFTIAILFMTMNSMQAQTALPTTAKCVSEEGSLKLYLNQESKATEDEPATVMSIWLTDKGRTTKLLVTNPMAEGVWSKMTNGHAAPVDIRQIAAADKAMIIPYDNNLVYIEGCPDARNVYSYILNLSTKSVIQLPSNSGLVGFVCEDDAYIVMQSYRYNPDPEVGGRFPVLLVYDLNGKFFKELSLQK
jgi:hypothetical protein